MKTITAISGSILTLAALARAATVEYYWDITWVWANPDGKHFRPVIGVNGQWPCPKMEATKNDVVRVVVSNKLGNETTGIHFHGINQINTNQMDGPSGTTQCPVPPGSSITYEFTVDQPGTYWYHSHNMGQYPDGLRGPFVVHDPEDPYKGQYDEEVILSVSDWYYNSSITMMQNMLVPSNRQFRPPIPNNILVNEGQNTNIDFQDGKTYRVRFVNYAALASALITFDSHDMHMIMNDGAYLQPITAQQLHISPAQRYDFLISCTGERRNFPYLISLDINRDFSSDTGVQWPMNHTGYLVLLPGLDNTAVTSLVRWQPIDDSTFLPLDKQLTYAAPDKTIVLDFDFCFDVNGYPRACFNNKTYINQKVPALYTAATTGEDNTNPDIYGAIIPFIVEQGDIVQIVVNNLDAANHPFHLHGHSFQVVSRPGSGAGPWNGLETGFAAMPPKRDVVSIHAHSHAVLRYEANNPGVHLFHCHIEWHVEMGLTATIIEAPDQLRGRQFPQDHLDNCKLQNIPISGNAAGNANVHDRTGFVDVPPTVYVGAKYIAPLKRARAVHARL